MKKILFDVLYLYHLPHFEPVYELLDADGVACLFVCYRRPGWEVLRQVVERAGLPVRWVDDSREAAAFYRSQRPDWVLFSTGFGHLDALPEGTGSALIEHGAGVKNGGGREPERCLMDVRFVEGPYQLESLKRKYPAGHYVVVGYSKLDPLFRPAGLRERFDPAQVGLSPSRPTILFAPTFYPSCIERMADDWPREFSEYNLVVKPHFFTYTKSRYRQQREKIRRWAEAENVYVADISEYSLLPFMAGADLMISDASTALFEFAALNKPVVWCDFLKLRWTYRGPFHYRFVQRMDQDIVRYSDIAAHAARYRDLKEVVEGQLRDPAMYEEKRLAYVPDLLGPTDGKVSERIVRYLREHAPRSAADS